MPRSNIAGFCAPAWIILGSIASILDKTRRFLTPVVLLFIDIRGGSWLKAERRSFDRELAFGRDACKRDAFNATFSSRDAFLSNFWYYKERRSLIIIKKTEEGTRERQTNLQLIYF